MSNFLLPLELSNFVCRLGGQLCEVHRTSLLVYFGDEAGGESHHPLECRPLILSRSSTPERSAARRLDRPCNNQVWTTGAASSMWPIRSRRTLESVTSTPQTLHTLPLNSNL